MNRFSRRDAVCVAGASFTVGILQSVGNGFGDPFLDNVESNSHLPQWPNSEKSAIATNTYPWFTFAKRKGQSFDHLSEKLMAQIANTGIGGYEPIVETTTELSAVGDRLAKFKLQMESIYVNSVLHDARKAESSMKLIVEIADQVKKLGTKIIVTNPSPIRWGGKENKNDQQLRLQAKLLDTLGEELTKRGIRLAYHNHDAELRLGGREFHHMLTATDPEKVKFCLDAHWIFRGCGDSEVAVDDVLTHYMDRVIELHLRQSKNGIWTEAFDVHGDINYVKIFERLSKEKVFPKLVLEQAVETGSPNTQTAAQAHQLSLRNLNKQSPIPSKK